MNTQASLSSAATLLCARSHRSQAEVQAEYGVEWDRRYVTVLGVANQRLYEMRLQTSSRKYETSLPVLRGIMDSFAVREVDI